MITIFIEKDCWRVVTEEGEKIYKDEHEIRAFVKGFLKNPEQKLNDLMKEFRRVDESSILENLTEKMQKNNKED